MLLGVLAFHAYATAPSPSARALGQERHTASSLGPVLRSDGEQLRGRSMPPDTVALAFYGGPDPVWTPRILDVLARHHAHATFFVLGARVNEHPELVRRMIAEGHEVGISGFRRGDPAALPSWRRHLDRSFTQSALASAAGVQARLFGASGDPADTPVAELGRAGYLVVSPDLDGPDLAVEDLEQIVAVCTPTPGSGAVVRLHDAGSISVDATRQLLETLGPQGFRFDTVAEGVGLPPGGRDAGVAAQITGRVLGASQLSGDAVILVLDVLIATVAALAVLRMLMQLGLAHTARRLRRERAHQPLPRFAPAVSVIIPAYNEAANIVSTVRSLAAHAHTAEVEVIVVDDGSTDRTADLVEAQRLPCVRVIRQDNAGKPAALNAGINAARHDVLVLVDGDTVFEPDTIGHLVQPLADTRVGAVSGNTKVGNRRGLLGRWQHLEYCAGANLDRQILDSLQCIPTVPGAIGAFRREALVDVGGVSADTLAEDTDLTIAITRAGWRVTYEPAARAWTEAPTTLRGLYRQRYRWSYGTFQAMWKHRRALVERGPAGHMGRRGLTYLLLFQLLLPLLAPLMDVYVIYGMAIADAPRAALIWLLFLAAQTAGAGYAMRLDGESLRPLWTLPLQQLAYRQLTYLVVVQSLVTALQGTQLRWQSVRRNGLAPRVDGRRQEVG
ncbi:bifunctional polysaccharide deacetylase/glycosyltransferase family 2 protein [Solihabitans fulvus]|nr:bifunctional polysaccharide deacetylase/glycosyltransferase family 2 protein [Solihabitans fulvus]